MDSSDSAGNDQERNNNSRKFLLCSRRRYRDRIWHLSPETWLAIVFFLLILGVSLLNAGYYFASNAEKEQVMKFGAIVLCTGWVVLIFLLKRVHSRNWCSILHINNHRPEFVGVCIDPPIQQEFLSAMLLPEIEREWVPVETIPGFEPRHAAIVRPPTQQATAGEESRSKRRRNKKKKVNISVSEFDSASQESNKTIVQITTVDSNHEDSQSRDLRMDDDHPSKVKNQEREQEFNKPNEDSEKQSLQGSIQPTELNPDGENLNKLISQEKDQVRHQIQVSNHLTSSSPNDIIVMDSSFALNKEAEENPASDHQNKDSLQTTNGLMSEESYLESVKTTINIITGEDKLEKMKLALSSPDQNYVDNSSEQLNKTPSHWRNTTMLESEKSADLTLSTNTSSSEMPQVIPKPESPDFIEITSKKRNRRRKK